MSWLVDLTEYLEDQSVGTVGTSIFQGYMPPTPAACVVCYDAGGNYIPQGPDVPWSEFKAEIRVRSTSHSAALTLANLVIAAINHKNDLTMNSTTLARFIRPDSTPTLLEYDVQRRAIMLIRVTMQVQRPMVY